MEISIHIDAVIHIHGNPADLQSAIDKIHQVTADTVAKTENLNQAVKAADRGSSSTTGLSEKKTP